MSAAARKLLRFFDANLNSAKKIRELIGAYNDALRAQGNPNQGDVFGDKVTVDKNQLLDKVLKDHGQQQSELDNSGRTENGQSARYEQSIGAPDNETQGRPDSGRGDAQSNRTSGEQGQSERGRIDRGQSNDLTLTGQTESEIAHTESQIKLAEKQRELAEKKLEAQRAQDELHKTVQQRNESANDNFTLGQSAEDNVSGQDAMFSRSADTKAKYEARIDELFNGGKANLHGVTVLNKSDVLDMLGYGGKPVNLAESKVVMGMSNHPLMTADVWKKIPEWIENPAAVFESDTETNRLVFIAPELVRNKPVRIILIPDGGQLKAHVLLNAYDAHVSMPWKRWVSDGLMKYVDMKKAQSVLDGSNLNVALPSNRQNLSSQYPKSFQSQLTGMLSKYQGRARILTEKNLAGYRKSQQSVNPSNDVGQKTTGNTVSAVRQSIAKMFGVTDLSGLPNLSVMQTATPEVLAKIENGKYSVIGDTSKIQGAFDPKTGKVFLFADAIPQGQERGVFLHEVFHKRGRELMGEHYSRLKSFVDGWADSKDGTVERDIYTAAKARADASGETGARYDDELIAYSIEEAVNRGVEPNVNEIDNGTAQGFMGRVRQLFTNVMKKMHPNFNGKFTAEDMVTIAHAAAFQLVLISQ